VMVLHEHQILLVNQEREGLERFSGRKGGEHEGNLNVALDG
jgi:hypothetical protein